MSKLTDLLHKVLDEVGLSSLHGEVDELDKETAPADDTKDAEKGEEDTTNAAE